MIAIKDKEMPKNCSDCNMTTCKSKDEPWNYVCSINLKDIDFNETERAEHCPLVEIITCKDCVKGQREYTDSKKYCMWTGRITEDDFYCADAERKEQNERT